ncbi:MAG: hypothetical protein KatS3mg119_1993 [Rhodothalassiaceae bacterium]|nr:MAG: hypothetical protein KatS3mg119_1993 [Rhodothalassiaceae bacterium]
MKAGTIGYGAALVVALALVSLLTSGKDPWSPRTLYLVFCGVGAAAWLAFALLPEVALHAGTAWSGRMKAVMFGIFSVLTVVGLPIIRKLYGGP